MLLVLMFPLRALLFVQKDLVFERLHVECFAIVIVLMLVLVLVLARTVLLLVVLVVLVAVVRTIIVVHNCLLWPRLW